MKIIEDFAKKHLKKNIPQIKVGDVIKVHQIIHEGAKERIQVFEGIIIARHGGESLDATFTVRRVSMGVGIERIFPLHSPNIVKIEKSKSVQVRRAKLYYLRNLVGKKAKKHAEIREFAVWEEDKAKEDEDKVKTEQEADAKIKEEAKKKEQEELDQKFAEAQAAKGATEANPKSQASNNK